MSKGQGWDELLSKSFLLTGTVAKESKGRDLYMNSGFFKLVKGLKEKEMIAEGVSGFALVNYDLLSPKGRTLSCDVAEFWKVKDGKLDSIAIYFDTTAFSNFLAQ